MPVPDRIADESAPRIIVVGGGAAGLSCAWRLAQDGAIVTVLDRGPVSASALWASGGMLAAGFEACVELDARHSLAQPFAHALNQAADFWPGWVGELEPYATAPLGYDRFGVLTPLLTESDEALAQAAVDQAALLGVEAIVLAAQDLARLEPSLTPARGGILFPGDGQLDNRALASALIRAVISVGGQVESGVGVATLKRVAGVVKGVTLANGRSLEADVVVLATGVARIAQAPPSAGLRPVKGQMLAFELGAHEAPGHVIRGFDIYLAAKPGGRLVVGATVEPGVVDLTTDQAALQRLANRAKAHLPALTSRAPADSWSGLRPASADEMPVIGRVEPGLIVAGGGYRNGVLLAPLFAETVCDLAFDRPPPGAAAAFSPQRPGL